MKITIKTNMKVKTVDAAGHCYGNPDTALLFSEHDKVFFVDLWAPDEELFNKWRDRIGDDQYPWVWVDGVVSELESLHYECEAQRFEYEEGSFTEHVFDLQHPETAERDVRITIEEYIQ